MLTFQDFEQLGAALIPRIITEHQQSELYQTALTANDYDRQKNTTIYNYIQTLFSITGEKLIDFTATNNRIASNFFHRLNIQRCSYSLGNGIMFGEHTEAIKKKLGVRFDTDAKRCAYNALIHGV